VNLPATFKPPSKRATYADLEAVPPHLVAEIIFGALVTHPRPAPPHGTAQSAITVELGGPFQRGRGGPGGWIFMIEPELHLGPHVVVPDIAGWRRERLPHMPVTAYVKTPPDWVCELLSPSTENTDRGPKRRIYATFGVGHMWFVDAIGRRLEAYVLRDGQCVLHETFDGEDEVKAPPFDAVPFALAALWPLDPAPAQT
jgi:Uma2 family endonuclease